MTRAIPIAILLAAIGQILTPPSAAAQECRRSGARAFGQWTAGLGGAWAGGMAGFKLFDDPYGPDRRVKGDEGYTPNANTAFAIGSWLASAGAVYLSGNSPGRCGSFARTLAGSFIVTIPLLAGREEPFLPLLGIVFAAPVQSLGATLMYPVRRR